MKRVEVNDAGAIYVLGNDYHHGKLGLQRDQAKAIELWKQAAALGSSKAHYRLGNSYREGGDSKKAQFHYEAAAMAGHEAARCNLGNMELDKSRNMKRAERYLMKERAVKHYKIAPIFAAARLNIAHTINRIICLHIYYSMNDESQLTQL